jgi:hypothetical protein
MTPEQAKAREIAALVNGPDSVVLVDVDVLDSLAAMFTAAKEQGRREGQLEAIDVLRRAYIRERCSAGEG